MAIWTHIYVVNESRIIRNNVIKISRMLQRPNDRIMSALQNSNYASFAPSSDAAIGCILRDASNYTVPVHGCAGIFRCDENIRLARFFWSEKTVAGLMNR